MKKTFFAILVVILTASLFGATSQWDRIEKLFNKKGTLKGDVLKVTFPRVNLDVTIDNLSISPNLALTTWLAFKPTGKEVLMMGDLVLQESEVGMVEYKLDSAHIEITAMHNHLIGESPRVIYMHIMGHGDALKLAGVMKSILLLTGIQMGEYFESNIKNVDWSQIDSILGLRGTTKGNVCQYEIPRSDNIVDNGIQIPPFMGITTSINFQNDGIKAAVTGDFVLLANEIKTAIHTLISYGITVTAIHNHMVTETPKLFFLHFWGYDDPIHLADGIKAVINELGKEKKSGTGKYNLR